MAKSAAEQCVEEAAEIVKVFLQENGGYANGYVTYVRVNVEPHVVSTPVDWSTPKMDDLKVREVREKGRTLYGELHQVLVKHGVAGISVQPSYLEEGCYDTIVSVTPAHAERWERKVRVPW